MKYLLLLVLFPVSLFASEYKWEGVGSFHSTAWGKNENVPVEIKVNIDQDRFDSADCWEIKTNHILCSLQSYEIKNGNELWKEGHVVGSFSEHPLKMAIAYSTRGVELKSSFAETEDGSLNFNYAFDYYTGDYVHSGVVGLPKKH